MLLCVRAFRFCGLLQVVNKEFMETGTWEIEIGAKRYPCVVSTRPMYDPNNAKIKL